MPKHGTPRHDRKNATPLHDIRHMSYAVRHTPCVKSHTRYVICHTSYLLRHTRYVIRHTLSQVRHTLYVIPGTSYVIRHTRYGIRQACHTSIGDGGIHDCIRCGGIRFLFKSGVFGRRMGAIRPHPKHAVCPTVFSNVHTHVQHRPAASIAFGFDPPSENDCARDTAPPRPRIIGLLSSAVK